jgi:S1-C subfamily serine protease
VSDETALPRQRLRPLLIGGALVAAAMLGAVGVRIFGTSQPTATTPRPTRPIVQIVRQEQALPDLSPVIDRICPAVAAIIPAGTELPLPATAGEAAPAVSYSADGWLVALASSLPKPPLEAVFGDGTRVSLGEIRTDPVSGLAILKADRSAALTATFADQQFAKVGQYAIALQTAAGRGCSATTAMIASDFLADGGANAGYIRLDPTAGLAGPGTPLFNANGQMLAITAPSGRAVTAIPGAIAGTVVDELIRNSPSPTVPFGLRAIDYEGALADRLGDVRAGAGVAFVAFGSVAAKAGLQAGDIITSVDGQPVSSASELGRAFDGADGPLALTVQRDGEQRRLALALPPAKHRV